MKRRKFIQAAAAAIAAVALPGPAKAESVAPTTATIDNGPYDVIFLYAPMLTWWRHNLYLCVEMNRDAHVQEAFAYGRHEVTGKEFRIPIDVTGFQGFKFTYPDLNRLMAHAELTTMWDPNLCDYVHPTREGFERLGRSLLKIESAKYAPGSNAGHDS